MITITFFRFIFRKLIYTKCMPRYTIQLFFHLFEWQNIKVDVFLYYFTKRLRWSWRFRNCPIVYYELNFREYIPRNFSLAQYRAESFGPYFFLFFLFFFWKSLSISKSNLYRYNHQMFFHRIRVAAHTHTHKRDAPFSHSCGIHFYSFFKVKSVSFISYGFCCSQD